MDNTSSISTKEESSKIKSQLVRFFQIFTETAKTTKSMVFNFLMMSILTSLAYHYLFIFAFAWSPWLYVPVLAIGSAPLIILILSYIALSNAASIPEKYENFDSTLSEVGEKIKSSGNKEKLNFKETDSKIGRLKSTLGVFSYLYSIADQVTEFKDVIGSLSLLVNPIFTLLLLTSTVITLGGGLLASILLLFFV